MFTVRSQAKYLRYKTAAEYSVHAGKSGRPDDTETRVSNFAIVAYRAARLALAPVIFINKLSLLSTEGPFISPLYN